MSILDWLKEGKTVESLTEEFYDALEEAVAQYEQWQKEEEEKAKAEAAKKLELEYKRHKQSEARQALGAAIVNYFEALDMAVSEKTLKDIDYIIEALPQIQVVTHQHPWKGLWR